MSEKENSLVFTDPETGEKREFSQKKVKKVAPGCAKGAIDFGQKVMYSRTEKDRVVFPGSSQFPQSLDSDSGRVRPKRPQE